jgi:glycosyltransferase involved in cell wall biosynthesis
MKLFFVHQNFPAQFGHLARHYAADRGHEVVGLGEVGNVLRRRSEVPGARLITYEIDPLEPREVPHPFGGLCRAVNRGQVIARGAVELRRSGYRPDVVFTHTGWGEGLFLKDIFPEARILAYCEYFYRPRGGDFGFDPEYAPAGGAELGLRLMNAPILMALDAADWGVSPTQWQRARFPEPYARRISVIHDGIDTDAIAPVANARFRIPGTTQTLSAADAVVTYATRSLEPHRGFHSFMRALPLILHRHPRARIVVAGSDDVHYSPPPPPGESYRGRLLRELAGKLDLSRIHFVGRLPYEQYLSLLRVSSAHVYLTYPFVLSWSLLEAMAAGCLVVASRTAPVLEVVRERDNGLLADFFSPDEIAARVGEALSHGEEMRAIRARARDTIVQRYDLKRVCLPAQVALVERLSASSRAS